MCSLIIRSAIAIFAARVALPAKAIFWIGRQAGWAFLVSRTLPRLLGLMPMVLARYSGHDGCFANCAAYNAPMQPIQNLMLTKLARRLPATQTACRSRSRTTCLLGWKTPLDPSATPSHPGSSRRRSCKQCELLSSKARLGAAFSRCALGRAARVYCDSELQNTRVSDSYCTFCPNRRPSACLPAVRARASWCHAQLASPCPPPCTAFLHPCRSGCWSVILLLPIHFTDTCVRSTCASANCGSPPNLANGLLAGWTSKSDPSLCQTFA